jgi:hypothetical protein
MHWSMHEFLEKEHPEILDPKTGMVKREEDGSNPMHHWEASHFAATLGVSCEACHLGAREHVEVKAACFPISPQSVHTCASKQIGYRPRGALMTM